MKHEICNPCRPANCSRKSNQCAVKAADDLKKNCPDPCDLKISFDPQGESADTATVFSCKDRWCAFGQEAIDNKMQAIRADISEKRLTPESKTTKKPKKIEETIVFVPECRALVEV